MHSLEPLSTLNLTYENFLASSSIIASVSKTPLVFKPCLKLYLAAYLINSRKSLNKLKIIFKKFRFKNLK